MASYFSISNAVEEELFKTQKSKFIGFAYPVSNELEIKEKLNALSKKHPKATHICYAYRLGISGEIWRTDDNGEPNNTAGMPILGQLQSFNLNGVLCAVVRYFGETKLGVGGLKSAYKTCAQHTLQKAEIIEITLMTQAKIICPLSKINGVHQLVLKKKGEILNKEVDWEAKIDFEIPSDDISSFEEEVETQFRLKVNRV